MAEAARNLRKEIHEKLQDGIMRDALSRFVDQYPAARLHAYDNVASIDALRNDLRDMKRWTVNHIDEIADQFEASVSERGGVLYRAKDGDDL